MNERRRTLVIGYGNSLRGDDGAGPFVVRRLAASGHNVYEAYQLTPELAERLACLDLAIFVDAQIDLTPGELHVSELEGGGRIMDHFCSPQALLGLVQDVYGRAPKAVLVGIGAESFDIGERLSPAVERAACEAIPLIEKLLDSESP